MENQPQTRTMKFLQKLWWKVTGVNCRTRHCECFYKDGRCCRCRICWGEETFTTLYPQDLKSIEPLRIMFLEAMKVAVVENNQNNYLTARETLRWFNWLIDNKDKIKL